VNRPKLEQTCRNQEGDSMTIESTSPTTTETVALKIAGMTCGACERHVGMALAGVPGVAEVAVNRLEGTARVQVAAPPDLAALVDAVRGAGYDADVVPGEMAAAARASNEQTASCCGCCEVRA
jgi:copper chaperone